MLPLAARRSSRASWLQKEGALEIDVDRRIPHRLGCLGEGCVVADAGGVDQDVEPAQALDRRLDDGAAARQGADVAGRGAERGGVAQRADALVGRLRRPAVDRDATSRGQELVGDGPSDAA